MNPTFHSYWLISAVNLVFPFYEVGIIGSGSFERRNLLLKNFLPNIVLFGSKQGGTLNILKDRL